MDTKGDVSRQGSGDDATAASAARKSGRVQFKICFLNVIYKCFFNVILCYFSVLSTCHVFCKHLLMLHDYA